METSVGSGIRNLEENRCEGTVPRMTGADL